MSAVDRLLAVARGELGTTEWPAESNLQKYGEWMHQNGVFWCAIFTSWCLDQAGLGALLPRSASVEAIYRAAQARGWVDLTPAVGAIPVYDFRGKFSPFDHIGACVTRVVDAHTFTAIEGNTSADDSGSQSNGGGVFERHRTTDLVHGFIHLPLEDDMPLTDAEIDRVLGPTALHPIRVAAGGERKLSDGSMAVSPITALGRILHAVESPPTLDALSAKVDDLTAAVAALAHGSPVVFSADQLAVVASAVAAAVAAKLPPGQAPTAAQIADELARRLTA